MDCTVKPMAKENKEKETPAILTNSRRNDEKSSYIL